MKRVSQDLIALAIVAGIGLTGCSSGGSGSTASVTPPPPAALDTDGDGVPDALDAFPFDPACSVDSDGDGFPDHWNSNATPAMIAASIAAGRHLDAFPHDPAASLDSDGDGFPDAWNAHATPAMIAASTLRLDAFPLDPAASLDTDGDGAPDEWNANATPAMIAASALHLDAFPLDPACSVDSDGDGFPDAWNPGATPAMIAASIAGGRHLDAFPTDPACSLDSDGDGFPDAWNLNASPAMIAASISAGRHLDAFPLDPAASVDSDGDGSPDAWNAGATPAMIAASALHLDAFPLDPAASLDADGDGYPDAWNPNATPAQISASHLVLDTNPLLGVLDLPTGTLIGRSPMDFGQGPAGAFDQKLLLFEEFGPEAMPAVAAPVWSNLPLPQDPRNGPAPAALDNFLRQTGVAPYPTRLSNVNAVNPWKPSIEAFLGRSLVAPPLGVAGPAEGRPGGEDWAHQMWETLPGDPASVPFFFPEKLFKTGLFQSRVNQGARDANQRHGYAKGEFAPGGLYHNVGGPADGTTDGIAIAFHPKLPVQQPNSVWTFDGTLPPKLLQARYGEPVLMRNYNGLPMDATANNGFGMNTITTHEHNGHSPAESDGFANAFFFSGQFYDYHWPMQLAGFSTQNNPAGATNFDASDPRSAIPAEAGEQFRVVVNGVPALRTAPNADGQGNGTVKIAGDWRETMSTHWFHDHMFSHTAENVYKGNAAMMNYYSALDRGNEAVNDGVNLRFPSGTALSWGNRDYDVNLVIADKAWDAAGQLWFNTQDHNGFVGDVPTINLQYKPYLDVRARKYRFRILNGSVSRIWSLGLVQEVPVAVGQPGAGELPGPAGSTVSYNRVPFHMIANDGNILEHAVPFDGVFDVMHDGNPGPWKGQLPSQGIAERYDIIVDFSKNGIKPGDRLYFVNTLEHLDGKGSNAKIPMAAICAGTYQPQVNAASKWCSGDPVVGKVMELRVQVYAGTDQSMDPAAYEPGKTAMIPLSIDRTNTAQFTAARHHTYKFVRGGNIQGGHGEPWSVQVDGAAPELADMHRVSTVVHGDLEVWRIMTGGGWTHPVHIHYEEGIILSRAGKAPPEWEKWARKDMYRIGPENDSGLEVEIAYRARDFLGSYMEHCHNTMHEDHAMLIHWNATKTGVLQSPVPMPTWDGVFFDPVNVVPLADVGDGTGPVIPIP